MEVTPDACLSRATFAAAGDKDCMDLATGLFNKKCTTKQDCDTNQLLFWGKSVYIGGTCKDCPAGKMAYAHDDAFAEGKSAECVPMICKENQRIGFATTLAPSNV